jgi:predicted HAD superfamily Cof-like phosphohydrolase
MYEQVTAFHKKFGLDIEPKPTNRRAAFKDPMIHVWVAGQLENVATVIQKYREEDDIMCARVGMLVEELSEFHKAVAAGNLPDQADALVDLVYFALGTALALGLPWQQLFDAVHDANMRKEPLIEVETDKRGVRRSVKKPDGWEPPNLEAIIREHSA